MVQQANKGTAIEFAWQAVDGIELCGRGWLPEKEPMAVVCLVHGLGEHCGRYAHVGAAFNRAGYAMLAFDLRGHGRSGGQRGHTPSYDALLDDIGYLLDEAARRFPDRPRFLYGHSLGGNLVLNYTLRRRPALAGVISTGPLLRLAMQPAAWKVTLARLIGSLFPTFSQPSGLDADGLSHNPQVAQAYRSDSLVHDRVSAQLYLGMMGSAQWALDHAATFAVPLLLMHGAADPITSPLASQEFASRAPGDVTLKLWDGLYHELHNELQQGEVLAAMVGWMDAHLPPTADAGITPTSAGRTPR